ncbi:MAG: ABC transporter permease [Planctomycetes bacterium]|nr:ABC transporter permease [Planctomycetota bacterium]
MSSPRARSLLRLRGLLRKELLQVRRDPSSILLAVVMPVVLLFLFGYGVSLDPLEVPLAVVADDSSAPARDLLARFASTPYFDVVTAATMDEASALLEGGAVDGIVRVRGDFERELLRDGRADVQLVLNGIDANRASLIRNYVTQAVAGWTTARRARGEPAAGPAVVLEPRTWFNPVNESRAYLVPGLIALIMTLTGTLLTALVIAREWERGTMEAILATPLRARELLIGKTLPYLGLGLLGLAISILGGVWLFDVPLRGSLFLLVLCSSLFLLAALGLGLAFSAGLRVQFVAAQVSVIAGFLPAFFLSGLLFDLGSVPAPIRFISHIVPARYFVDISHTLFLAGDVWSVVLPDALALAVAATVFFALARRNVGERLESP